MREKELLKKSGLKAIFILLGISLFWFLFSLQISLAGYTGGPASGIDVGINSRSTAQSSWQIGSSGVYTIRLGIENVTGLGTGTGYMSGTNTAYPRIEWTPTLGTLNFVGTGSYNVTLQSNGVSLPSAGSVSSKLDAVGGVGTSNTFNNATLAGQGTITASFNINGLDISPPELSMVNGATIPLNTATGSITSHAHTGSDGTTQVSHASLTSKGIQTHTQIDDFIASKASASGVASLDANSLVVQNPASGTSTPGASKTVMSDGTGKILDGWLSSNVPLVGTIELGTDTTGNTDNISEGSTNKYYTDTKVSAVIGSSSITSPQVSPKITFTSPAAGQFLKIVDAQGNVENATSSVSVDFSAVTGSVTASQLPLISGLLGSATSSQLPTVMEMYGTTTEQAAGAFGQLYVQQQFTSDVSAGTATGGIATADTYEGGYEPALAFDNSLATRWNSPDTAFPHWLKYQLSGGIAKAYTAVRINKFWDAGGGGIKGFQLQGSTNDTDWGNLFTGTATNAGSNNVWETFTFNNTVPYTYYRLYITSSYRADGYTQAYEVEWYNDTVVHTRYSAKYKDPVNGNTVFEISTPGTATTRPSYIYCNATTTVWGLGTNTSVTGTLSGAYAGWSARPIRVGGLDIGSTIKIKENVKDIKIKPDLLDAEGQAKLNYMANNKIAWIAANGENYTTVVNETGTGSVTVVDTVAMETDYNNYIEFEWASDLNQDVYTESIQKGYEKGFWQMFDSVQPKSWNPIGNPSMRRKGFVVEEMPAVVWGEDNLSIDFGAVLAYMTVAQKTLKADTVFALNTLKELLTTGTVTQQKLDYCNDRLDVLNP